MKRTELILKWADELQADEEMQSEFDTLGAMRADVFSQAHDATLRWCDKRGYTGIDEDAVRDLAIDTATEIASERTAEILVVCTNPETVLSVLEFDEYDSELGRDEIAQAMIAAGEEVAGDIVFTETQGESVDYATSNNFQFWHGGRFFAGLKTLSWGGTAEQRAKVFATMKRAGERAKLKARIEYAKDCLEQWGEKEYGEAGVNAQFWRQRIVDAGNMLCEVIQ